MSNAFAFTDQSPDDLCLSLVEGNFDATQFGVIWEEKLQFGDIVLTPRVIGASHIITFEVGDVQFHEMLACAVSPPGIDAYQLELRSETFHRVTRQTSRMHYHFYSNRVAWGSSEPESLIGLINRANAPGPNGFGHVCDFPQGDLPAVPKTVLWGRLSDSRANLVIKTAHSYPGKGVVFSTSRITPKQR